MDTKSKDMEYPFRLFSGTVESNVTCEYCKSSSSTLDPIEDIGLDVTPMASSSSSSPPPGFLADVGSALQRFARAEALDASYKCDKCGDQWNQIPPPGAADNVKSAFWKLPVESKEEQIPKAS